MKETIKLRDIWKTYHIGEVEVNALQGLSLSVKEGDFIAVMGPSGSGKSTAVNMIGFLDRPSKGDLILDGEDTSRLYDDELAKLRGKKVGFIFQTFNLISNLSALDNVALPALFQGVPRREAREKAAEFLKKVGLGDRLNHKPGELSGGQRQRVAIARALINDPEIILADEPTGNLDSKTSDEVVHLLLRLNKEGKTIVLITHDEEIANHAKKILHLRDGRIIK